ncbi:MAG: hypothetical protein MZV63_63045 [Marinilabiliales bacterium]|nr:hypothetical protein [Marinilabiliales bacterium]
MDGYGRRQVEHGQGPLLPSRPTHLDQDGIGSAHGLRRGSEVEQSVLRGPWGRGLSP